MIGEFVKWHFMTFGGGHVDYRRAATRLGRQASASNFFQSVKTFNEFSLQVDFPNFWRDHKDFIDSHPRGFGKWIWKPFLILDQLNRLQDGQGLCYFDSGCYLNFGNEFSKQRFHDYLNSAKECEIYAGQLNPISGIYEDVREKTWTRLSVLNSLQVPVEHRESNQIQATYVFLVKSSTTLRFAKEWFFNCLTNNYDFLQDGGGELKQEAFIEHRFDQSVFSCLFKKFGFQTHPDESMWYPSWQESGRIYPIWAMRNRTGKDPFRVSAKSLVDEIYPKSKITLNLANKFLT